MNQGKSLNIWTSDARQSKVGEGTLRKPTKRNVKWYKRKRQAQYQILFDKAENEIRTEMEMREQNEEEDLYKVEVMKDRVWKRIEREDKERQMKKEEEEFNQANIGQKAAILMKSWKVKEFIVDGLANVPRNLFLMWIGYQLYHPNDQ